MTNSNDPTLADYMKTELSKEGFNAEKSGKEKKDDMQQSEWSQ